MTLLLNFQIDVNELLLFLVYHTSCMYLKINFASKPFFPIYSYDLLSSDMETAGFESDIITCREEQ